MFLVPLQVGDLSDFNYLLNNPDDSHPIADHGEVRIYSSILDSYLCLKYFFSTGHLCGRHYCIYVKYVSWASIHDSSFARSVQVGCQKAMDHLSS
jgi:hypothetical protein